LTTLTNAYNDLLWNIGFAICHQLPERSFFYGGMQIPVCARDMGTYLGFLVVVLFWLLGKRYLRGGLPDAWVLAVAAICSCLYIFDALSSYSGLVETTNGLRLATGLIMGAATGILLLTVISIMALEGNKERVFQWKDLVPIFSVIAVIGAVLYFLDLGAAMFYVVETTVILGLLLLEFTLILLLISILANKKLIQRRDRTMVMLSAAGVVAVLLIVFWLLHHAANQVLLPL